MAFHLTQLGFGSKQTTYTTKTGGRHVARSEPGYTIEKFLIKNRSAKIEKYNAHRMCVAQAGGLARGPPATRKSVRWADQVTAPGGFSMGGSATQQVRSIDIPCRC